jgi:hypothetical protein
VLHRLPTSDVANDSTAAGCAFAIATEADAVAIAAVRNAADTLRLDAYDSPAGAGPFYEKCAFREVGRVRYREVPLVYYQWMTPQGAAADDRARF